MKNLLSFEQFILENEDASGYNPETPDVDLTGAPVKSIEEIKPGKEYKIGEKDYLYQGVADGVYTFNGEDEADVIIYSAEELVAAIEEELIICVEE